MIIVIITLEYQMEQVLGNLQVAFMSVTPALLNIENSMGKVTVVVIRLTALR